MDVDYIKKANSLKSVTKENINHHLGLNNLYIICGSAIWMLCLVQKPKFLSVADKSRKVPKRKDEVITVFPLHEKDSLFLRSYFIQEVKSQQESSVGNWNIINSNEKSNRKWTVALINLEQTRGSAEVFQLLIDRGQDQVPFWKVTRKILSSVPEQLMKCGDLWLRCDLQKPFS